MELNLQDLNSIREYVAGMVERHDGYASIVKAIDYIKANKAYLAISDAKKLEREANEKEILRIHGAVKEGNQTLSDLKVKVVGLKNYIDDKHKERIRKREIELDEAAEKKRLEIEDSFSGVRQELKDKRLELKKADTELDDARKALRGVQVSIRDMLGL